MSYRPTRRALALSLLVTLAAGAVTFTGVALGSRSKAIVKTDGLAYFLYARSLVLDFDTDVTAEYDELAARIPEDDPNSILVAVRKHTLRDPATGRVVLPWPIGMGVMMAPFYAAGYGVESVVAAASGRPADDYGMIPQLFFGLGSLLYGLLGFWATLLVCRRVAGEERADAAWVATLALIFASPVAFYVFISPSMAHATSYGFVALLVLLWWRRWHGEAEGIVAPAAVFGLLMAIRYQNFMYFPLLVALVLRRGFRGSWARALREAVVGSLTSLAVFSIQIFHYLSKHGQADEALSVGSGGFQTEQNEVSIVSHNFFDVLFSCLHGAFYWTPVVAVGCAGLIWAARRAGWARIFLLTFCAHVYLIGALADGTAGHAFGMRYLSETAALLAPGLAFLIVRTAGELRLDRPRSLLWPAALALLVAWNGLLALAFGVGTISGTDCVTHRQMVAGVGEALARLLGSG
jgi:hypothetical protein